MKDWMKKMKEYSGFITFKEDGKRGQLFPRIGLGWTFILTAEPKFF